MLERLEHGVYKGDSGVDPSTLAQYCAGVNGDTQSITDKISKGQEVHVRHPPVEAAWGKSPFQSTLEFDAFRQALKQATTKDLRPAYLGLDLPTSHLRRSIPGGPEKASLFHSHTIYGIPGSSSGAGQLI